MKIALVRQKYSDFGGAERYLASLAEHLAQSEHEIHLFASEWRVGGQKPSHNHHYIKFHRVPVVRGLSVFEVMTFALNARRLLRRESFDIIHSFERTLYQDVFRAGDGCHREWLIQRKKIDPFYKTVMHTFNPLHISLLWIEKKIFTEGNYKMIIANSSRGKAEIMRHYGVPGDKIEVIYNPVDTERFRSEKRDDEALNVRASFGIPGGDKIILFVGSGFKRKGLAAAIQSMAYLDTHIRMIVVGKDRIKQYRSMAQRLGVEKRIHFAGPVSGVEKFYRASDMLVFPTIYEPFGNVCLEAIASGLPVVVSRICGASEILKEGANGYIIEDPLDAREIAEKVKKGLALDRKIMEEVNAGLLERFTWERHASQVLDIYKRIFRN
ncbi:MAG: glycosyltransferase family 4 protein [Deltaproteobacteria bacterium]|nr:glycosyltransferase family 4 protein [Deltaproteobacteria bacterium]